MAGVQVWLEQERYLNVGWVSVGSELSSRRGLALADQVKNALLFHRPASRSFGFFLAPARIARVAVMTDFRTGSRSSCE